MNRNFLALGKWFCTLLLVLCTGAVSRGQSAQQVSQDSMLRQLARAGADTNKVNLLLALIRYKDETQDLRYANQALALSQQLRWNKGTGQAYFYRGLVYGAVAKYTTALDDLDRSAKTFRSSGDYSGEFRAMDKTAKVYELMGQQEKNYAVRLQTVALLRQHGDKTQESEALRLLGNAYVSNNDYDKALEYWQQSIQLKLETGDSTGNGVFEDVGILHGIRMDYERALRSYELALARRIKMRDVKWQAKDLKEIGLLYSYLNQPRKSVWYLEQALQLEDSLGGKREAAAIETAIGDSYQTLGDYDRALAHFFASLRSSEATGDDEQTAKTLNDITTTYYATGDTLKAVAFLKKSLGILATRGDTTLMPVIQINLGSVYALMKRNDSAEHCFREGINSLEKRGWHLAATIGLIGYAEIYHHTERHAHALNALCRAFRYASDSGNVVYQAKAIGAIGRTYLTLSRSKSLDTLPDSFARFSPALLRRRAVAALSESIALSLSASNTIDLPEFYLLLSEAQEASGDKIGALASYKAYVLYRDSLLSSEKIKAITRRDLRYEFEKTQAAEKAANAQRVAVEAERGRSGIKLSILSGAGLLLLFATGFYFQRKRSKDRYAVQIAELKQEALNAQMSDHFIGNTMDSINGFIVANDRENASRYLVLFSRLIRRVLENATQRLVTVEEDLGVLRDYMALEKLRFSGDLQYEIQNPDGLDLDGLLIPPMIFQTLAENAIKHGFNKAASGRLLIRLSRKLNTIECVVEDNGVGRSAALQAREERKDAARKSFGTSLAEKLLATGSSYLKDTAYKITDLLDQHSEPAGTRVTFVIPLIPAD